MPRVHNQAKQKNKPFKGKSKGKSKGNKIVSGKRKLIAKKSSANGKRVKASKVEVLRDMKSKKSTLI